MLPLMRLAWTLNRRLLFQFSPWLAFYLAMLVNAQANREPMQSALIAVFLTILLTVIVTMQGLLLPVEEFILALPVSRSQVVRAKYLSCLLGLAAGWALPLITGWLAHFVAPTRIPPMSPDLFGISGVVGLYLAFGIFCFLPFLYQFGPSKGLTFFSVSLIVTLAGGVAWRGRWACVKALLDFSGHILERRSYALAVLAVLLVFGLASLSLSVWAYRRKLRPRGLNP